MTLLPKFRSKYGEVVGVELFITFPEIYNNEKTFFDADAASSAASATSNGTNFSIGQYLVLGQIGAEKTEIIKVHAATAPTSSLITFATNTVYAHNRGDLIQFIPYNQITVERSTDAGVNFTPLSAINIRPDSTETYLQRSTDASTDVYRFRFYNSADNVYSEYSDTLTASGFDDNTVYAIKNRALLDLGEKKNELITDEFLNESLNVARRELDRDKRVRRWSFRTAFNSDIGDCIPGRWSVSAPTDLRNRNTNENILSLRVGKNGRELLYQDKIRFNENYRNISHSTLNGSITTGSTSIILTSSGDFDESGTVDILDLHVESSIFLSQNQRPEKLGGWLI